MTLPSTATTVTYPLGATTAVGAVVHVETVSPSARAVLLDTTCCHPVDAGWPDQGADRGVLRCDGGTTVLPITDCIVAATDGSALFLGADIPVGKGADGWVFLVAHLLGPDAPITEGDTVEVVVDADYRAALSAGHTACHLASLALNAVLAGRWTKPVRTDGLGSPDFDGLAIESSRIGPFGSTDRFRLNKSLRRKGFTIGDLGSDADERAEVQASVNATLADWVRAGSAVRIECDGDRLTDRRFWACELNGTTVRIPCGGTHAHSLAELGAVRVELTSEDADGTPVLVMQTRSDGR